MKIGISTSVIHRGSSDEGRYVLELVRALLADAERHEFVLFVLEDDLSLFEFARPAMKIVSVAEVHRSPLKDVAWHQLTLPRLARELALDVLHVPSQRRLLWPHPCGLVATIHTLGALAAPSDRSWRDALEPPTLLRRLAHRQDELVAVTRTTADAMAQYFRLPAHRVTVIHNGVDHTRFTPAGRDRAAATILQRYGVHAPFFLSVAPLEHPGGGHLHLIQAFNHFKTMSPSPWQLVLLGGNGDGAQTIHEAVRRSPYAQDVHCVGAATPEMLPAWYRAAGVFVHSPASEEGLVSMLEAMACGGAVLAANTPAATEICGDAAARANPDDIGELRRQLARLAFDGDLRGRLSAAGVQRAQHFNWRQTATATLEVYGRVARGAKAPVLARSVLTTPVH